MWLGSLSLELNKMFNSGRRGEGRRFQVLSCIRFVSTYLTLRVQFPTIQHLEYCLRASINKEEHDQNGKKAKKRLQATRPTKQNKTKKKSIFRSLQTEKKKTKNSSTLNKMVVEGKHCEHLKQEIINKAWVFSKK